MPSLSNCPFARREPCARNENSISVSCVLLIRNGMAARNPGEALVSRRLRVTSPQSLRLANQRPLPLASIVPGNLVVVKKGQGWAPVCQVYRQVLTPLASAEHVACLACMGPAPGPGSGPGSGPARRSSQVFRSLLCVSFPCQPASSPPGARLICRRCLVTPAPTFHPSLLLSRFLIHSCLC